MCYVRYFTSVLMKQNVNRERSGLLLNHGEYVSLWQGAECAM